LHEYHGKNPHYSQQVLLDILVACRPQAILVELPATKAGKPTVREGRLVEEYARADELWASQQAAQKLKIPIHPFDMDRRDDLRQEQRYWERRSRAEKDFTTLLESKDDEYAELRALRRFEEHLKKSILAFAGKGTPEIINSEAFDSILRARKQLQVVFDGAFERLLRSHPEHAALRRELDFVRREWNQRNEVMAKTIEGIAGQYKGRRLVVVTGAEHRHMLRDSLQATSGLILREYWNIP
jgi:hypothetical protein